MNQLLEVSLRQKAVFIAEAVVRKERSELKGSTAGLVANMAKLGFGVSEPLLQVLNETTPVFQLKLLEKLRDLKGMNKNWTPLVKDWGKPTGESLMDHLSTLFANIFGTKGTVLQCGHIIPYGTFPLERYNGCPFCGTPFERGKIEKTGQGSNLVVLEYWTEKELISLMVDLLTSKTALDATQVNSLKILLKNYPLPEGVNVGMKETLMVVIDALVAEGKPEKAQSLFSSPVDVMRYLWYKHTGFLQIIEPKTIIKRTKSNSKNLHGQLDQSAMAKLKSTEALKLKYGRKEGKMVAQWLNHMPMEVEKMCEAMHPKRGMWVRFIRELRLAEYSKLKGFEKLKNLLDIFYNELYEVFQGVVNHYRLRSDVDKAMKILKQRPGLFARSLFANLLWFGKEEVIAAFEEISEKVPARLLITLGMYSEIYFDREAERVVKPLGGTNKRIPGNRLLGLYNDQYLEDLKEAVIDMSMNSMKRRFANVKTNSKTMYIDPLLFMMPLSIGDRSDQIQDMPVALMGTRFPVEGNKIRLFMQWGNGLPAQHLDMDLSCMVAYDTYVDYCSYSNLVTKGCKHSGDIRQIPEKIGTAEYIELDLEELRYQKARFVSFTCNAYSNGSLSPNMVVGWMNSKHPMHISESSGVAYDPSCVQHQVRISNGLSKGLVFGVLDVVMNEIIWLEMPFSGQITQNLDTKAVKTLLRKLKNKMSIGNLLTIKADAQKIQLVDKPKADEVYTSTWGINAAAVSQLLID